MEIDQKLEWIKPDRFVTLCDKYKSDFSDNRLLIIGIGKEGVETAIKCKHIVEKRFVTKNDSVDFLVVGERSFVEQLKDSGTVFKRNEILSLSYDECLYNYLNTPARISPYAMKWFDLKLKNTSPMTPTYSLHKRQCGRLVLFNCIKSIINSIGEKLNTFSLKAKPVEIVLTGNLGDAFFGGMYMDLAYIIQKMFSLCKFPVQIKSYMLMSDVTEIYEKDPREIDISYANQFSTLLELNKFSSSTESFTQKYTDTFEVDSNKFPLSSCFLISSKCEDLTSKKSFDEIIEKTAEKILLRAASVFPNNKDDDAERVVTYNLMKVSGLGAYNFLSADTKVLEVPLGDIASYLSLKSFKLLQNKLHMQNPSDDHLNKIISEIPENWRQIAEKSGEVKPLDFSDESISGLQPKNIKINNRTVREMTEKWVENMSESIKKATSSLEDEIVKNIINQCENAISDIDKGTYYATEIMKKCMAQLRLNIAKLKSDMEEHSENLEKTNAATTICYSKVLNSSILTLKKQVDLYLGAMQCLGEARAEEQVLGTVLEFYANIQKRLSEYNLKKLNCLTEIMNSIIISSQDILKNMVDKSNKNSSSYLFSLSNERAANVLDNAIQSADQKKLLSDLYSALTQCVEKNDEEKAIAEALISVTSSNFDDILSMDFKQWTEKLHIKIDYKQIFGEMNCLFPTIKEAFKFYRTCATKALTVQEISQIRTNFQGINYIWNFSTLKQAQVWCLVKNGLLLPQHPDFEKWERSYKTFKSDPTNNVGLSLF